MTDQEVIKEYNNMKHDHNKMAYFLYHASDNAKEYIKTKYKDSRSKKESLIRILNNIQEIPTCPVCGNILPFIGRPGRLYGTYCSNTCKYEATNMVERHKQGCLKKYGVENISQVGEIKKKKEQSFFKHYGVKNNFGRQETINTVIKKYGVTNYGMTEEYKEKVRQTCLDRYGVKYAFQSTTMREKSKQTCLRKYGVEYYVKSEEYVRRLPDILQKSYNTKKKNGTFSTSKPEEDLYLYIKEKFPQVERQYKCDRYPWKCDFYIPELDCFIEYNGFVTHGKHAYNPDSIEDVTILQEWKTKSKDHPLYKSMIQCWTISDVKKRIKAKENNLNYHEFWNFDQAKKFVDSLYE